MNPTSQLIAQGQHPTLGSFFHILLPTLEADVSHLLVVVGGKATLHKILATGEIISQALDVPMLKAILAAIDSFVG